jgi:hypothetical protein
LIWEEVLELGVNEEFSLKTNVPEFQI